MFGSLRRWLGSYPEALCLLTSIVFVLLFFVAAIRNYQPRVWYTDDPVIDYPGEDGVHE